MFYRTFGREVASVLLKATVFILSVVFLFSFANSWYELETISDGSCNIAVLPIEGMILPFAGYDEFSLTTTPTFVRNFITEAENDPNIKGILFEINSPGGAPVASEQISDYIQNTNLPNIGLIGDLGTSGAYLVAASTDTIIASNMSQVGSIGVTMSYLESSIKNEEEGLTYVELSSGKFKDAGNPDKALTEEERELFMRDIDIVHDEFVKLVAALRHKTVEEIQALADGSSMPGVRALEYGLIDKIGGRKTAKETFSTILSLDANDVVFCEYQPTSLF